MTDLPHGIMYMPNGTSLTPIEYDWKELYYQAMLAIASSRDGTNPEPLKEQMARHRQMMQVQFIFTGPNVEDGNHG